MIGKHSNEVLDALKSTDIEYQILTYEESKTVLDKTIAKFTGNTVYKYPVWENLQQSIGVDYQFSWEWFKDILKGKEVVFFFEPDDDGRMFRFQKGNQIPDILNNCYGFVFYVTNYENSFLFGYNDHDNLIACGDAKDWLTNYPVVKEEDVKIFRG